MILFHKGNKQNKCSCSKCQSGKEGGILITWSCQVTSKDDCVPKWISKFRLWDTNSAILSQTQPCLVNFVERYEPEGPCVLGFIPSFAYWKKLLFFSSFSIGFASNYSAKPQTWVTSILSLFFCFWFHFWKHSCFFLAHILFLHPCDTSLHDAYISSWETLHQLRQDANPSCLHLTWIPGVLMWLIQTETGMNKSNLSPAGMQRRKQTTSLSN